MSEGERAHAAESVETERAALGARAAGFWRLSGDRLYLVAFAAAPDMPREIAEGFSQATQVVPLDRTELGIVQAAHSGHAAVSIADQIDASVGSGRWLRAFGADRSIAVPLHSRDGACRAVLSVAVARGAIDDVAVIARLQVAGARLVE